MSSGKLPYELMYGFKPDLGHLTVFECLCFSTVFNTHDKFCSNAETRVFIRYSNQ